MSITTMKFIGKTVQLCCDGYGLDLSALRDDKIMARVLLKNCKNSNVIMAIGEFNNNGVFSVDIYDGYVESTCYYVTVDLLKYSNCLRGAWKTAQTELCLMNQRPRYVGNDGRSALEVNILYKSSNGRTVLYVNCIKDLEVYYILKQRPDIRYKAPMGQKFTVLAAISELRFENSMGECYHLVTKEME